MNNFNKIKIKNTIGAYEQIFDRNLFKLKMFKYNIVKQIINYKIGICIGKKINKFIKSYGTTLIRRPIVQLLCAMISQIDENNYKSCRGTMIWKRK